MADKLWPSHMDADYFARALEERNAELGPDAFRKLYMQEPVYEPMPEVYWFFAPEQRTSERVLMVDYDVNPRMPCIRIVTERSERLCGLRGATVTMIDPRYDIRQRERDEFRIMERHLQWREWDRRDREYLKAMSRRGN